jgi:hypothetical protein
VVNGFWIEDFGVMKESPYHVARGGSWHEPLLLYRSASVLRVLQTDADEFMGFWVMCSVLE